ncbi:zinc finger protein [Trichonephila clavipes]|nr:zinc finger protein [Trichonephila clavipes]
MVKRRGRHLCWHSPLLTTTPHQREDVSALDRFSVHRCPTRRVFSGTELELVTMPATIRYLYHSATTATNSLFEKEMQGCGSPVVKVSNHGRHVMSSIPVPLKTRRVGQRCTTKTRKAGSGFSSSPRSKGRKAKRSVDSDGFTPPSSSFVKRAPLPVRPLHPPSAPSVEGALLEGTGEEDMELTQQDWLQAEIVVPVVSKKPRIPTFFVSPKGDWRQLVALAKLIAPSFQSQMSGRFLKVTVSDEVEYRDLSRWLENSGVEFKSFMLKQDRPVKVVVRGLPSNTEPEDIVTFEKITRRIRWSPLACKFKASLPSSSGRVARFLGGQTGCAAPKAARVGRRVLQRKRLDVDVSRVTLQLSSSLIELFR